MSELQIAQFPCLSDNYGFLLHDPVTGLTATIDTPDADEISRQADSRGWQLSHIFNTHHHADHAGGNLALKSRYQCRVIGPANDADRIPGIDEGVADGDRLDFGGHSVAVTETPGHTTGHIVYFVPDAGAAFVGDTLFAMGCGRLFEGTPEQMWNSLQRLMAWPDQTRLYCAHEYTLANAQFALTVEPGNEALRQRAAEVKLLRDNDQPTVPTTLALEKATNPFLRPMMPGLKMAIGLADADELAVFAQTRALKDRF